jgi:formate hydrogenlyase subunit 3/multisubunit Na+/H+ antiporter MnhD subunit
MKLRIIIPILILCTCLLSSCELVGDIFKAGVWTGFLIIIGAVALVGFILFKVFGSKKS